MNYESDRTRCSSEQHQLVMDLEFAKSQLVPDDYDPKKPENIDLFGDRLKKARVSYPERQASYLNPRKRTANGLEKKTAADFEKKTLEIVGKAVKCTKVTVWGWEQGSKERDRVPPEHIRRLCIELDVSRAYLLGFVGEDEFDMDVDIVDGKIEQDEAGNNKKYMSPMAFDSPACVRAVEDYRTLSDTDSDLFWPINRVIQSKAWKKKIIKEHLKKDLEHGAPDVDHHYVKLTKSK